MANEQVSLVPRELRNYGFPIARFLSQEEQARYEDACKSFSGKAKRTLDVNSNLWKVLLLNQIGIKTASLNELELALENGLGLQGHYEDAPAVVLRSAGDSYKPNDSLAKELVSKLKLKDFKTPKVITGLEIVADENSPYGLRFRTTDKTQITNAPDLKNENHQRRFTKINPDYSIEFNDKGNRTLWTRPEGLSWLCLGRSLVLNSRIEGLEYSDSGGSVVVVSSAEGSAKNFEEHLAKLQTERDKQLSEIQERYEKAEAILRGR